MVQAVAEGILGNLRADQPHLAVVDARVSIFEIRMPDPKALDLGTDRNQPALDRIENFIFVRRAAIPANVDSVVACGLFVSLCRFRHDANPGKSMSPRILTTEPARA